MCSQLSLKKSTTERLAFVLFATFLVGLIWIVHSTASRVEPTGNERSPVKEQPVADKKHKCPNCAPPGDQEIYIPLIDLAESQGGEIVFNSRSPQAMSVTPVFYTRGGQTVIANPVEINSAEIRYLNIKNLLPESYRNERNWGGFSLRYYGTNREMWSQFRFLGVNGGSNVDEFFTVKDESRSSIYEAGWWMPEKSEAIVALGNISDAATSATVTFSDGHARTVNLQPHATEIVRQEQRNEGVESVKINVNGAARSIVTSKDGSFNGVIRFYDPNAAKQPNLYANGFRLKSVTPHMVLKNTTSSSLAVVPRFVPLTGAAGTFSLPQVVLAADETKEVDLGPLMRACKLRPDLNVVSVEVTNWAAPGSIVGSLYGTDEQTGMDYDTPLRDSGLVRTMTGSYPWKIAEDFTTVVYITNISDQKAEFVREINYQGGHVILEPRKLAPHETAVFDLQEFRQKQTSDSTGNRLPLDVSLGQFKWSVKGLTNGNLLLIGRAEMVSRLQNISSSYSCNDPCPPYYSGDLNPFPPPVIIVNGNGNASAWETAYYSSGYSYSWAASADWSANSSAVSLDPTAAHTTTLTGEVPGSPCITADMGREESYGWDGLNCYDNYNSYPVEGGGCTDVVDVKIYQNGSTDITDQTKNVIVGQQISLSVHVEGTTEAVANIQWNVPGTKVASYAASSTSATVNSSPNMQANPVNFYWVDGGDNREVHLGCRIGTEQFDKKATFNVKRPTASVTTSTGTPAVFVPSHGFLAGSLALEYGDPSPGTPGIKFTESVSYPQGFNGDLEWIQVVNTTRTRTTTSNVLETLQGSGCDTAFPYPFIFSNSTEDSPGAALTTAYNAYSISDSFTMWLMFRPSGTTGSPIWVPLRKVDWSWSGNAFRVGSFNDWSLSSSSHTTNPGSVDTTDFPEWSANIGSSQFH